jgi:hypothetical protein
MRTGHVHGTPGEGALFIMMFSTKVIQALLFFASMEEDESLEIFVLKCSYDENL